ncbi:GOLD domain-containing protein [Aphelenchoides bicaudatus]|nr:GOLD domain-containing protein [Aphelenchoides bicaudatus]
MWKLLFLATSLLHHAANGFLISVDAEEDHCFFERLKHGQTFTVMFEVAEGGFLDIDLLITGPDNLVLYKGERETSGRYTFSADREGIYNYCFGNKASSKSYKSLMFTIDVRESQVTTTPKPGETTETEDNQKLFEMVNDLSQRLGAVKTEQEYMQVRDRTHRSINDSTNQRVVLWAIFEAIVLLSMSFGQIFYLKRFFESRFVV